VQGTITGRLIFSVAMHNVSVWGGAVLYYFSLDNIGTRVLLRFRSWEVSLIWSTRSFRVMPVLISSAGTCSVRESVEVSVCTDVSLVSTAEKGECGCELRKSLRSGAGWGRGGHSLFAAGTSLEGLAPSDEVCSKSGFSSAHFRGWGYYRPG
jgi:hypothetical protein